MENIKILLVEDNPDVALRTEAMIYSMGYELLPTADNSEAALASIKNNKPDVLVMDIDIKGELNGIEVVEKIKNQEIAVLFMTGYEEEAFYEKARKTQPVAYLVKPVNRFTFQSALETAIKTLGKKEETSENEEDWPGGVLLKDSFFVKRNNLLQKIKISDIYYIQSDGNYCDIISSKKFAVKISLTQLLKKLPQDRFIRIHKRYIIQADLIDNIDIAANEIYVGGIPLPLGPKFKDDIIHLAKRL